MVKKQLLNPQRVREIEGNFAYIEHRFLKQGFWQSLSHHELLLYFFLILVGIEPMHPAVQPLYNQSSNRLK